MTQPDRNTRAGADEMQEAIRRMEAIRPVVARYFSPEITALIDPDAPEVIGGPGLPRRKLKPKRP